MKSRKAGHRVHSDTTKKTTASGGQSRAQTKTGQKTGSLKKDVHITIHGRPALKKNSRDIGFAGYGAKRKFIPLQSKSYKKALSEQLPQLKVSWGKRLPVGSEEQWLWIKAIFYAGKGVEPDLDGAEVGLGDLLQKAGIVSNDRWIKSWDGSRVVQYKVHKSDPRTEITIMQYKSFEG